MTAKRSNEMSMVAKRSAEISLDNLRAMLTKRSKEYATADEETLRSVWAGLPPRERQVLTGQASRTDAKRRPDGPDDDRTQPAQDDAGS